MTADQHRCAPLQRGYSLLELLIALMVLSIGILALAKLFPTASRAQVRDRMRTAASYYCQEKLELLRGLTYSDPNIQEGRYPNATSTESCGTSGAWQRYYQVTQLNEPLDNLRTVSVVVRWNTQTGTDSVTATTYVDR